MLSQAIYQLRTGAHLSQEQFARLFHVSQQAVQKWETGESTPALNKIIKISRHFGVSLDSLILENDNRTVEEMKPKHQIKPNYPTLSDTAFYSSNLLTEYRQSVEQGLDIEAYRDLFVSVSHLPKNEIRQKLGDILFEIVTQADIRNDYPYTEPSDLPGIQALRKPFAFSRTKPDDPADRVYGAWMGRICGCMLGKSLEGIRTDELILFLKNSGNYPMHRYVSSADLTEDVLNTYQFPFASRPCADRIQAMPADDDTNYLVLAQRILCDYGRDFTPFDVSRAWLAYQPMDAYCTAEYVAFFNFVNGYVPPQSAVYKNPYREWIGAQIRGDYFGYINPGNPEAAAEMAWRDASISHIKNGIYGEMMVAAMLAVAAVNSDPEEILMAGLAQIPSSSRLYEAVCGVISDYRSKVSQKECFRKIHAAYDEYSPHGWCHTIPNAMIVAASLLYGGGDFGKSICMAVETGFDTDCNGATVGSVLGMAHGFAAIPESWSAPFHDTLETSVFGMGTVRVSDCVRLTLEHIQS